MALRKALSAKGGGGGRGGKRDAALFARYTIYVRTKGELSCGKKRGAYCAGRAARGGETFNSMMTYVYVDEISGDTFAVAGFTKSWREILIFAKEISTAVY